MQAAYPIGHEPMDDEPQLSLAEALRSEFPLSAVVDRIESKVEAAEGPPMDALTPEERRVYTLFWFIQDILNNGLYEALRTSSGEHVGEFAAFMRQLSCAEFAQVFEKCAAMFDPAKLSDIEHRRDATAKVGRPAFEALDAPFFHKLEALEKAVVAHVATHPKQFHLPVDDEAG